MRCVIGVGRFVSHIRRSISLYVLNDACCKIHGIWYQAYGMRWALSAVCCIVYVVCHTSCAERYMVYDTQPMVFILLHRKEVYGTPDMLQVVRGAI